MACKANSVCWAAEDGMFVLEAVFRVRQGCGCCVGNSVVGSKVFERGQLSDDLEVM